MTKLMILILAIALLTLPILAQRVIADSYDAENRGDYPLAMQIMQELAAKDATDPFYQIRIAWLQYQQGLYPQALASYQAANRLKDNIDAHTGIINCQLALGNWSEALALGTVQSGLHPENPVLLGKTAYAAYMLKDYAKAADFYARILNAYPWDMENRGYLVNNLYLSGDLAGAREQFLLLKKYYPSSSVITIYKDILK